MENASPHSSCISRPASMSVGESSWTMHFASFLASSAHRDQEMDRQGEGRGASESSFSSGFSSPFHSLGHDDAPFIPSDMVCHEDDEDDSLQDTACSSAASPKITIDMPKKSIVTMGAEEMNTSQLAKSFRDADSRQKINGVVHEVVGGDNNNGKQLHELSDLRKKGLCLVPLSMLIDYLG